MQVFLPKATPAWPGCARVIKCARVACGSAMATGLRTRPQTGDPPFSSCFLQVTKDALRFWACLRKRVREIRKSQNRSVQRPLHPHERHSTPAKQHTPKQSPPLAHGWEGGGKRSLHGSNQRPEKRADRVIKKVFNHIIKHKGLMTSLKTPAQVLGCGRLSLCERGLPFSPKGAPYTFLTHSSQSPPCRHQAWTDRCARWCVHPPSFFLLLFLPAARTAQGTRLELEEPRSC